MLKLSSQLVQAFFWARVLATVFLSLVPVELLPQTFNWWYKAQNALGFAVLTTLGPSGLPQGALAASLWPVQVVPPGQPAPPTSEQGLSALLNKPAASPVPPNWRPYLEKLPADPWNQPYRYLNPGMHGMCKGSTFTPMRLLSRP